MKVLTGLSGILPGCFLLLCVFPIRVDAVPGPGIIPENTALVYHINQGSLRVADTSSYPERPGRWIRYLSLAAGGALVMAFDKNLNEFSQRRNYHGRGADRFFNTVEDLGTEMPYIVAFPAFVGYGLIARNEKSVKTGGELAVGVGGAQGVTWAVKRIFGRKRPYESSSPYHFFEGGRSFYSGHTISAFTFATIVSKNFPRQDLGFIGIDRELPIVPVISYTAAGMVAIQRLYANVHWASDVCFGALAGYCVGSIVVHFGNKIHIYSMGISVGDMRAVTAVFRF